MIKTLFTYSLLLFVFAVLITVLSLSHVDIEKNISYVQLMNVGVFISFIPTIFILRRNNHLKLPIWTKIILLFLGLFSLYFFFISFFNMTPVAANGKYLLVNHGNTPKEIDETEYIKIRTQNFVSYSSRWMLFCCWTTFVLYYFIKTSNGKN